VPIAVVRFDHPEDGEAFLTWAVEAGLQTRDLWTWEAPMGRNILIEVRGDLAILVDWAEFVVSQGDR
jgi:hypothetical protein